MIIGRYSIHILKQRPSLAHTDTITRVKGRQDVIIPLLKEKKLIRLGMSLSKRNQTKAKKELEKMKENPSRTIPKSGEKKEKENSRIA